MGRQLFWRRMPRRMTHRWLVRPNRAHMTTHVTGLRRKSSFLPDEIKEQILLKLQCIKSIVTCTSVCKSWYVLIKSRWFINMHLSRPDSSADYFLCSYFLQPHYSIEYYNNKRLETVTYDLIFPEEKRVTVHGSCNGLICYTEFDDVFSDIYLWNPTIRKLKILPRSRYYTKHTAYGFWCDTISDDHKVAKISCAEVSKVEVYSLSSNSWSTITMGGPSYSKIYLQNIVHVNGTLYWLTFRSDTWTLNSLNMKTGMFRDTLIWPAEKRFSTIDVTLGAHSDSIFVLRDSYDGTGLHVFDESLKEVHRNEFEKGEKELLRSMGVINNGDAVLFQKLGADLPFLVFDIRELKFKHFCSSPKHIHQAIPFVQTLVLLDDGDSRSAPNAR